MPLNRDMYTLIYIKLWRKEPIDKDQEQDFTYIIEVIP